MHINNKNLSKKILSWYDNNKRILPWRISQNSKKKQYYRILSEFMLQQTQVKTVIPYFNNFVKKNIMHFCIMLFLNIPRGWW